jgi:HK97 family phage major capsid protein
MDELQVKLGQIEASIVAFGSKSAEEVKNLGSVQAETKTALANLQKQFDEIVVEMKRPGAGAEVKSLGQELKENESLARLLKDGRGRASVSFKGGLAELERKTTVTSSAISTSGADAATSGVVMFDRTPGIVPAARRRVFLRDLLTSIPTSLPSVDYVKVETDISDASPQVEAANLFENALSFTTATASVRTIGTYIPASVQIMEDFAGLEGFIRTSLVYAVRKEEEDQLLSGDNTGQNLNGLITQATAFSTALLSASDGWEYADMIGRAVQQIESSDEVMPGFVALHPSIWWSMRLAKTSTGEYIYGNPSQGDGNFSLFGLTPIRTNNVSSSQFLVGSAAPTSAVIRDRAELTVEISTEDGDNFKKGMLSVRAMERIALVVFRPASFIKGTFTQSPA